MKDTTIERNIREILERDFKRVGEFDTEKGGIYVETTDDPRGWMLGDKTRKKYEVSNVSIKSLTDLLVIITPNNDGSEIKVSVYNPEEIGMMLLSKNDDVGSSIEYGHPNGIDPTELTAKMGQHICIESIMRRNWIRAQIFPGSNIVEIVKIDESEMLKLLEFSHTYKREIVQNLVNKYYTIEDEINVALSGLENYGQSCDCKNPNVLKQIHEGDFDEILKTCILCGGTVEKSD